VTLTPRRWLIIIVIIAISAVLAVPMRETIYNVIVLPVAYIGWALGILYRILPQVLLWWVVIAIIFFILLFSMLPNLKFNRQTKSKLRPRHGQVEDLSIWMERANGGVYFKWLIANRLGKLAYQILLHRESGRPRSVFTPLVGEDWKPSRELQQYLETGLHGSFSDYHNPRSGSAQKTPLDYEIKEAVEFLESKVENGRSNLRNAP
jgi:hypothetical protein